MHVRCCRAETLGVFWSAPAPAGRHRTAPCDARGSLGLGAVCGCVTGLGLPPSPFPGSASFLFTLAPPLAQLDGTGVTSVI